MYLQARYHITATISLPLSLFLILVYKVVQISSCDFSSAISWASRAQVLPVRFSACWGVSTPFRSAQSRRPLDVLRPPIPLRTLPAASSCASETDAYNRGCATKKAAAREQQLEKGITLFSPTVKSAQTPLQFYLRLRPPRFW